MNFDTIRLFLQYGKLKNYLRHELGYTEDEAVRTIRELRKMERNILRLFIRWFQTDELPDTVINGVTIRDIMERQSLNPVAAFLALNWVRIDPGQAKYSLSRPVDELKITEDDKDLLRQYAKQRGWDASPPPPEDTSDLSGPQE